MIAEPIKAKQNLQFVSNLMHAIKNQEVKAKSDLVENAKTKIPKLSKLNHAKDIKKELINELSSIPNQLEYLIEESFPYDAYTFIEELEADKIDMIYQILFFCIIHTLDVSIIYESGASNELREYQVLYSSNSEDSFDSGSPVDDAPKEVNFNYYVFIHQDGSSEVMSCSQERSQVIIQPAKAHSFQAQPTNQKAIPQANQMSMTFDALRKENPRVPTDHAPGFAKMQEGISQASTNQMMYQCNVIPGAQPQMFIPKQPNLPNDASFQTTGNKLNLTVIDTLNSNNSLNRSANLSLNNSYSMEQMNEFNDKFNHSMQIGGGGFKKPQMTTKTTPPPGFNNFKGAPPMGPFGQMGQFPMGGRMMPQVQNGYFPMKSGMEMRSFPPPPPMPHMAQPSASTFSQPPLSFSSPTQAMSFQKVEDSKQFPSSPEKKTHSPKEPKTSLKTDSRQFKPATAKSTNNSFYQKKPKAHLSYMQSPPGGDDLVPHLNMSSFNNDLPMMSQINTTFQGMLPSMMPPPPFQGMLPQPPIPPSSSINSSFTKPSSSVFPTGSQVTGRLKYFKEDGNYGFIVSDLDGENIFFHYSEMKSQSLTKEFLTQAKSQYIIRVVFQIVKYIGKYKLSKKAVNIYVTEVNPV
uniref:CSD domain-containing protein n=1 Tax=Euplotes harpa TaxID=151035 RepID=A0A7S3N525_9SPIT|mmetsp:Transcript_11965/g.13605  ORF Transcript_11965/g.13605 Transcript_11965/m.13605 type:complete len:632 (+) Transcript_11965:21-1916(+)